MNEATISNQEGPIILSANKKENKRDGEYYCSGFGLFSKNI